jgi:SulP family sulfate permease
LLGLIELNSALAKRGISLNLAEVKGPVMDRLRQSSLLQDLSGKLYLSTALATNDLSGENA